MQEIALLRYWRVYRPGRIIKKSVFIAGIVIPWAAVIVSMSITGITLNHIQDRHSVSYCVEQVVRQGFTNSWSSLMFIPLVTVGGTVAITTCYAKIMIYYRRRCRVHVQSIAAVQMRTSTENISGQQFVQWMDEFYRRQINQDKRVVMNSFLVVSAFYMANIPTSVLRICVRFGMIRNIFPLTEYVSILNIFSCAINPVFYSIRSRYFRAGVKGLLRIKPNTVGTVTA